MFLQRFLTRKGYGVQSPFAYHIVRDVICEHTPFYAYGELNQEFGRREDEEFLHLLLRISNDLQPKICGQYIGANPKDPQENYNKCEAQKKYILAGCKQCNVVTFPAHISLMCDLIVADSAENALKSMEMQLLKPEGCLAFERKRNDKGYWKKILSHPSATIVFEIGRRYALVFYKERMSAARYYL